MEASPSPSLSARRTFTPLPSTSSDQRTINLNDIMFNECYHPAEEEIVCKQEEEEISVVDEEVIVAASPERVTPQIDEIVTVDDSSDEDQGTPVEEQTVAVEEAAASPADTMEPVDLSVSLEPVSHDDDEDDDDAPLRPPRRPRRRNRRRQRRQVVSDDDDLNEPLNLYDDDEAENASILSYISAFLNPWKRRKVIGTVDLSQDYVPTPVIDDVIVIDSDVTPRRRRIPALENLVDSPIDLVTPPRTDGGPALTIIDSPSTPNCDTSRIQNCPVCFDGFSSSRPLASTFCGHVFCKQCITIVMKTTRKCPTCRKLLKGKGFHLLFL